MPIKVIGAGLPRTGTLSMKHALEELGLGPCHHMAEVFAHPGQAGGWAAYFRGEPVDWEELLKGYASTVDAPSFIAWRDLMQRYPEARVVLTVRDAEPWYASMRQTILADGYLESLMATPMAAMLGPMLGAMLAIAGVKPDEAPPGPPPREALMALREAHNAAVVAGVPPERLLVFQVSEGWEPLCNFLGADVPSTPFPRVNDTASFHQQFAAPGALADA